MENISGLDENFFMYYEEVELCYRIKQYGWLKLFMHFDNPIDYLIWDRENSTYKAVDCKEIIEQKI